MSSVTLRMLPPAGRLARLRRTGGEAGSLRLIERHARVYRHAWLVFASGILDSVEPARRKGKQKGEKSALCGNFMQNHIVRIGVGV